MKIIQGLKVVSAFAVAGFILVGCQKKEEPAATPPPATPVVTNTPAVSSEPVTNTPAVSSVTNAAPVVLTPEQAKDHVGEEAIVRGKVFGVHITAKGDAFINVGAAYPNAPFTAVCFQGAIPEDDLKKLEGQTVSFKGKIKIHNDQVEIILDKPEQISE